MLTDDVHEKQRGLDTTAIEGMRNRCQQETDVLSQEIVLQKQGHINTISRKKGEKRVKSRFKNRKTTIVRWSSIAIQTSRNNRNNDTQQTN